MVYHFLRRLAVCCRLQLLVARTGLALLLVACATASAQGSRPELLLYCGITMVRPMSEIVQAFEKRENVRITLAQGGSEDLYQSAKKASVGDLYLPGEPTYRDKYLHEGLLGEFALVGYNQLAILVPKGNPKNVKGDPRELLRKDLVVSIGNASSGSVGKESKDILDELRIYQKVVAAAAFLAPDSRGLNNALKKGEADAVLNWRATGYFADNVGVLDVIDLDPKLAKPQALLLNLLTFSRHKEIARRFIAFTAGDEGQAIFRKHGFLDNRARR
ncbi:MAG: substrate-binding domain-containing protein [Candidatus Accumulibacter sp.]|uniref:substrate-binding domain-containing protein n=1 Tax=Accumulibacter sp. TaxID=2053492 RepID=UPI0028788995|nr:substrate-binding domain-containing protein [Accumulibacter sp.]MDS4013932.1 substrate-binding domain-containing protein [Accumulibacter sp.]